MAGFSKQTFLITVGEEGRRWTRKHSPVHDAVRFSAKSKEGLTGRKTGKLNGTLRRCHVFVCVYLCKLWTPPSIWADAVLFSNFRSPEYIMALPGGKTGCYTSRPRPELHSDGTVGWSGDNALIARADWKLQVEKTARGASAVVWRGGRWVKTGGRESEGQRDRLRGWDSQDRSGEEINRRRDEGGDRKRPTETKRRGSDKDWEGHGKGRVGRRQAGKDRNRRERENKERDR